MRDRRTMWPSDLMWGTNPCATLLLACFGKKSVQKPPPAPGLCSAGCSIKQSWIQIILPTELKAQAPHLPFAVGAESLLWEQGAIINMKGFGWRPVRILVVMDLTGSQKCQNDRFKDMCEYSISLQIWILSAHSSMNKWLEITSFKLPWHF